MKKKFIITFCTVVSRGRAYCLCLLPHPQKLPGAVTIADGFFFEARPSF